MVLPEKRFLIGNATDPWAVVLTVHSWAEMLKEGRVRSCAEIARREGITRVRVSQLWPLSTIAREQLQQAPCESVKRSVSLRALIRFAQNISVKLQSSGGEKWALG
jgi:hypothetical protein